MTNYLLAVTQAVTNPNVIELNTFWLGVWFTFFFICWLIFLGFKKKVLQVPKFISAKEAFQNFLEIINRNATNEGVMNQCIDELREVRDSLRRFSEKHGNTQKIVNALNNMNRGPGNFKIEELLELTKDIESLSTLVQRNVGMAMENIDYRRNYSENAKVPQTKKVEVDNGRGSWQYVDAQYAPKQEYSYSSYDSTNTEKFMTDEELRRLRETGMIPNVRVEDTYTFEVRLRNGDIKQMEGRLINAIQNATNPSDRKIIGYDFLILRRVK